jgi:transposase
MFLRSLSDRRRGQLKEQQETGKRLARDTSTVTRWLYKYRLGGLSGLLEIKKAPGAKLKVSRPQSYKQDEELVSELRKNLVPF